MKRFIAITALTLSLHLNGHSADAIPLKRFDQWNQTHDRVWLGHNVWANPMEDWRVENAWASCKTTGANRSIHAVTHQIKSANQPLAMSVELARPGDLGKDGGAGFRIGIRSDINEYRANCFTSKGINAGIDQNTLFLGKGILKLENPAPTHTKLTLTGTPEGQTTKLVLQASDSRSGKALGTVTLTVPADQVLGNVALVSQFTGASKRKDAQGYRFRDWKIGGKAFTHTPEQRFGPILWSMYSLSDSRGDEGFVMKISALTGPMGAKGQQNVELEIEQNGEWKKLGTAKLDTDAWVATFRIPHWNEKLATPYRLIYREKLTGGKEAPYTWTGIIRSNPVGRPVRLGALTCQNDYAFPYEPVANNLVKLDLDLLYFSGDQLYESHGGFGIIRNPAVPAIHNYLRKYYQFGWSFRESMRNAPTICLPDDHDVFHGNIWGEGGAPFNPDVKGPSGGGYKQPARMVNVVHKTNCAHHPDVYDPTPCKQDISVYYGDMVYGNVNWAITADRQWKSGPERANTSGARYDHVKDPDFDTSTLDKPGLVMFGERQEEFLKKWAADWRNHEMKVLFSQTVLSAIATHHGSYNGYLKGDLDSGGWPQTPRNRVIDIIRPSMALHVNGDQHLSTLSQYGVKSQRDSNWSFCTPAIAVGYPRWWRPDEIKTPHQNRPSHKLPNTGEFLDGFGNKAYVYAVGNPVKPEKNSKINRYDRAHLKASGFGVVTIDTKAKTYHMDSFRFNIDATDGKPSNQFPGWPVTIHQKENRGENVLEGK